MRFNRTLLAAIVITCAAFACNERKTSQNLKTTINIASYFPVAKGTTWQFLGSKLNQKGEVIEKYEVKVGVTEIREDKEGSIVGFSRVANPSNYSNEGPEEYLITKNKIVDYSGDGCPLLKEEMAVDEQWEHPFGSKNATKVRVVSLDSEESLGNKKISKCIVIKIYEPHDQRHRLMTFAPGIGLIMNKIFIGDSHLKNGKPDYLETLKMVAP